MGWRWLLAFSLGLVLCALVPTLPGPGQLTSLAIIAALLLVWSRSRLLAVFLIGGLWFLGHATWHLADQWPDERAGEVVDLKVRVASLPEWRGDSIRFVAKPVEDGDRWPDRIQIRWFRPDAYIQPGQHWQIRLRMLPPQGRLNFHGFDYTRYLISQKLGAIGVVRDAERLRDAEGINGAVNRGRQYLAEVITAETDSLRAASLMRALSIADRSAIDDTTRELLAVTGTAHLLAISGLHVGMVAMLAGAVGSLLAGPLMLVFSGLDRRRFALVLALSAALLYALLAGLTLPTQRALIMLSIVGLAFLLRRGLQPSHALLVAFAAVLVLDPLAALATGFWMSFAAVAVLIWTFAWRPGGGRGVWAWMLGLLRAQLMIGLGLLAINAGLFSQIYWAGFPANLIAIPLVGFWILPNLLASLLLIALDWPASFFLGFSESGLIFLLNYLEWLNANGPDALLRPPLGLFPMLMGVLGSLWLIAPAGWPARWLGLALLFPVIWPASSPAPAAGEFEIDLLDVGRGQAVLIRSEDDWTLYDTGPGDGEGRDVIGQLLPGILAASGRDSLDRLIVSSDHAGRRGGVGSVAELVAEDRHYASIGGHGRPCVAGHSWQVGETVFEFLHPSKGLPDLGPNSSCVLLIRNPGGSVLLTGRIDSDVEARLIDVWPDLRLDVLVLSDGGHRRASSASFLEVTSPRLALVSVERYDRFDRPHQAVLDRLADRDIDVLSTAECGALRLRIGADGTLDLQSARGHSSRFWHFDSSCP